MVEAGTVESEVGSAVNMYSASFSDFGKERKALGKSHLILRFFLFCSLNRITDEI